MSGLGGLTIEPEVVLTLEKIAKAINRDRNVRLEGIFWLFCEVVKPHEYPAMRAMLDDAYNFTQEKQRIDVISDVLNRMVVEGKAIEINPGVWTRPGRGNDETPK